MDRLAELAFGPRPGHELYDLRTDPGQLRNVATEPALAGQAKALDTQLMAHLADTGDPRALGSPRRGISIPTTGGKSTKTGPWTPQSRRKGPPRYVAEPGPLVAAGCRPKGPAYAALAKLADSTDLKSVVLEDVWV